ncbi:hypothetical protein BRYFOR_07946 [Marvinbryantia formatexigens DSM 14469]|uniref:Uncharacterized protein n=1 Tax=Marvinbryantia formatexigens DSM 14469 TaxID=478749 RepID=C6LH36_9FIRM|nr:hypothetical protein BRYFOR_07946 [Marvinbryantia formatexigens DSM 14469]
MLAARFYNMLYSLWKMAPYCCERSEYENYRTEFCHVDDTRQ